MPAIKYACSLSALASVLVVFTSQIAVAQNFQLSLQGQRFSTHQAATPLESIVTIPAKIHITLSQSGAFKQTTSTFFPGDIEFRFLTVGDHNGAASFDLLGWRTGVEYDVLDAKGALEARAEAFFLAPNLLLKTGTNRQAMATPPEWQADYQFESFFDQAGRPATVVIDQRTGEAVSARSANLLYEYQNYLGDKSARTAQSIKVKAGGNLVADWQAVQITELVEINEQEFVHPKGYQKRQVLGALRVEKIAENTYRINGSVSGYHTHFVVGENSIAVFDTPIFTNEITRVKSLIQDTAPGKPISHIVFSHTHRDHIGGAAQLAQDGTQIITGKEGKFAILRQLGDKLNANAVEVISPTTIDLGGRQIQVIPVPSSHASEMLIAYDRQSKTLFQGDFFMMPDLGPAPVGFTVNRELMRHLTAWALVPDRILSVHGRVSTTQELMQTVTLLDAEKMKK